MIDATARAYPMGTALLFRFDLAPGDPATRAADEAEMGREVAADLLSGRPLVIILAGLALLGAALIALP